MRIMDLNTKYQAAGDFLAHGGGRGHAPDRGRLINPTPSSRCWLRRCVTHGAGEKARDSSSSSPVMMAAAMMIADDVLAPLYKETADALVTLASIRWCVALPATC